MSSVKRQLKPNPRTWQVIQFVGLTLSIAGGLALVVSNMWTSALQEGGFAYVSVDTLLKPLNIANHAAVYLFFLGIFLAFAALWLLDAFKYYPGIALWVGILSAGALFWIELSAPLLSDIAVRLFTFLLGAVLGLQLGGLELIQWLRGDKQRLRRHRRLERRYENAVKLTLYMLLGAIAVGLIDRHLFVEGSSVALENRGTIPLNLLVSAGVLLPVVLFQPYRDTERIIQLGPARSGKTSIQGGLYMSADDSYIQRSGPLNHIHSKYMRGGEFPPRTKLHDEVEESVPIEDETEHETDKKTALVVEFVYMTEGLLFPKEKIITSVDYPGEILTGGSDKPGVAEFVRKTDNERDWTDARDSLLGRGQVAQRGTDEKQLKTDIATLVQNSDVIMFTIPLDDFITPIVTQRPDNLPEYHKDAHVIWEIDECSRDDDAAYRAKRLSEDEWTEIDRRNGDLRPRSELPGLPLDPDEWRGSDGSYMFKEVDRVHPDEYLREYHRIIDRGLADLSRYNFIWLATMADLVRRDFRQIAENAAGAELQSTLNHTDIEMNDSSNIEIGQDPIEVEHLHGRLNRDKKMTPKDNRDDYRLFAEWTLHEYLCSEEPLLKNWIYEDTPEEEFVFPLWFNIDDRAEKRFKTVPPALKGSNYLMNRLKGIRLKRDYPMSNAETVRREIKDKTPFTTSERKPLSYSEMGYQVIENIKNYNKIQEDE